MNAETFSKNELNGTKNEIKKQLGHFKIKKKRKKGHKTRGNVELIWEQNHSYTTEVAVHRWVLTHLDQGFVSVFRS